MFWIGTIHYFTAHKVPLFGFGVGVGVGTGVLLFLESTYDIIFTGLVCVSLLKRKTMIVKKYMPPSTTISLVPSPRYCSSV